MQTPPWAPGGPSGGRLGCQEACRNAVLGGRRPVRRPSWAPGGPSGGCLGRPSWAPGGLSGGRLGRQEAPVGRPSGRIVGFADSSNENAGFAQAAGRAQTAGRGSRAQSPHGAKSPRRKDPLRNFCIDVFDFPGPPGGVRQSSKIGPKSFQDVSRYPRSVRRAQVEVQKAPVGSESGSWAGRTSPRPAQIMKRQVEKWLTRPDID